MNLTLKGIGFTWTVAVASAWAAWIVSILWMLFWIPVAWYLTFLASRWAIEELFGRVISWREALAATILLLVVSYPFRNTSKD